MKKMNVTGPLFATRPVWLTSAEQRLYRLDEQDLGAQPVGLLGTVTAGARAVLVSDIWFEAPLGDEWVAAYRLSFQAERTRLVIGEIRIFPARGPRPPFSGRWLGDILGSQAPVPVGGLNARTVRRATMRGFVPHLNKMFRELGIGTIPPPPPLNASRDARRGRPPKPAPYYATIATVYEKFYSDASARPTSEVRSLLRLSASAARSAVGRARRMGFLGRTEQGRASGRASHEAHQLALTPREFLQRFATGSLTGGKKKAQRRHAGRKKPAIPTRGKKRA